MTCLGESVTFRYLGDNLTGVVEDAWPSGEQSAYRIRLADGRTVCCSDYAIRFASLH
jgi:hypothetical protein